MKKAGTNPKVDAFLRTSKRWSEELAELRTILLGSGLTEEFKWGKPCYMFRDANVVIILPLKAHCALLFCKGVLIDDGKGLLIQPGENTQAARQMRFTGLREVDERKAALKAYLRKAIEVEEAGLEVVYKKPNDFVIPDEFQRKLGESPALKTAFFALTPGRQKSYVLYFSAAKQSKTRQSRIEKYLPQILEGKGMNDDYRESKRK